MKVFNKGLKQNGCRTATGEAWLTIITTLSNQARKSTPIIERAYIAQSAFSGNLSPI